MAPMAIPGTHPQKRSATQAEFEGPPSKKLNHKSSSLHRAKWDPQRAHRMKVTLQDTEIAQAMLTRSIGLALKAVGFEGAAPEAVESFRLEVETYLAHYLADVRHSMLSCRRTQALPGDFLQALHTHQLSLRSLLPHLDPPVSPKRSQYRLRVEPGSTNNDQHHRSISLMLSGSPDQTAKKHIPKHFPELPSKHTYKATPDFPKCEHDPRKVREQATEEGRLGEEALRRLVGASSTAVSYGMQPKQKSMSIRARRDQLWKETMQAVTQGAGDGGGLGGGGKKAEKGKQKEGEPAVMKSGSGRIGLAVNAEKRYWRKAASQGRGGMGT